MTISNMLLYPMYITKFIVTTTNTLTYQKYSYRSIISTFICTFTNISIEVHTKLGFDIMRIINCYIRVNNFTKLLYSELSL